MILALIMFVVLIVTGLGMGELGWSDLAVWVGIAVGAAVLIVALGWPFIVLFSVLALMDVILILVIFKGDIRIR